MSTTRRFPMARCLTLVVKKTLNTTLAVRTREGVQADALARVSTSSMTACLQVITEGLAIWTPVSWGASRTGISCKTLFALTPTIFSAPSSGIASRLRITLLLTIGAYEPRSTITTIQAHVRIFAYTPAVAITSSTTVAGFVPRAHCITIFAKQSNPTFGNSAQLAGWPYPAFVTLAYARR